MRRTVKLNTRTRAQHDPRARMKNRLRHTGTVNGSPPKKLKVTSIQPSLPDTVARHGSQQVPLTSQALLLGLNARKFGMPTLLLHAAQLPREHDVLLVAHRQLLRMNDV